MLANINGKLTLIHRFVHDSSIFLVESRGPAPLKHVAPVRPGICLLHDSFLLAC